MIIDAPVSVVWSVLVDVENQPEWNPVLRSLETIPPSPTLMQGKDIRLTTAINSKQFRAKLTRFVEHQVMAWRGRLLSSYLLEGELVMELVRDSSNNNNNDNGTTKFVHYEHFSGVLLLQLRGHESSIKGTGRNNDKEAEDSVVAVIQKISSL